MCVHGDDELPPRWSAASTPGEWPFEVVLTGPPPAPSDIFVMPSEDAPDGTDLRESYDGFIHVSAATEERARELAWKVYRGLEALLREEQS
jgi:hypothetical protein